MHQKRFSALKMNKIFFLAGAVPRAAGWAVTPHDLLVHSGGKYRLPSPLSPLVSILPQRIGRVYVRSGFFKYDHLATLVEWALKSSQVIHHWVYRKTKIEAVFSLY